MSFGDNDMMMELFRSEVESHSEVLSNSLLKLERDASDTSVYDSMMRSAHSIKGAARIVRVESAVNVSHVMEDCFVAAQRGELQIKPSDFDLLLRSLDLLVRISEATKNAEPQLDQLSAEVYDCVEQLKCLREGRPHSATLSDMAKISDSATVSQSATMPVSTQSAVSQSAVSPTQVSQSKDTQAPVAATPTSPTAASVVAIAPQKHDEAPTANRDALQTAKTLVLECGTALVKSNAETLRQTLLRELTADVSEVRFDLSQTKDIDPIGLAFLASAKQHVEIQSRASVRFAPLSDDMRVVLRVSGIAQS